MIDVRFFASLREQLGCESTRLPAPEQALTVADVRDLLAARGGAWSVLDDSARPLMCALNQTLCDPQSPVCDGDEVAFFPPVTGG